MFPCSTSPGLLLCNTSPAQPGYRLTHSGDWSAVGHKTRAVVEDSTAIEERDGASSALVKSVLEPPQPGTLRVLNLIICVILPKEDQHQICPRGRQERGHVEGQEDTGWFSSLLKGANDQELEQRKEPWDKSRRPQVSHRTSTAFFYNFKWVMPFSGPMTGTRTFSESMLSLLVTR